MKIVDERKFMKGRIKTIFASGTVLLSVMTGKIPAQAADTLKIWTLQNCIDHAVENNISIQQSRLNAESSEIDLKNAKAALFPSVGFSTNQSLINRPFRNSSATVSGTEIISSDSGTSYTGNYGLNASWTIYNGGENRKNIRLQKINSEISRLDTEESINSIEEEIVQLYLQILYSAETVKIRENTLAVSREELRRGQELFDAGSISKADLAQLYSQTSSDNYDWVSAKASLADYRLQLKQLLDIEEEMELMIPDIRDDAVLAIIPDKDSVYASALETRPEILSGQLGIDASELDIEIAKAGYLPSLSLSAGIGTNHTSGNDYTFTEQIKNGWNNSIGLTLSIPITSNRQNKSAVEKARIQSSISKLELNQKQKDLYKTIESLWTDAASSQEQYIAAKAQEKSAEASYELASGQFALGMKNTVELLTEKNNFTNAVQEALQAKYMAILNICLLKFYNGESLSL